MRITNTFVSIFLGLAHFAMAAEPQVHSIEPVLPVDDGTMYQSTLLPEGAGYFPTESEYPLLRGPANARTNGVGATYEGPDRGMQTASGLFPYRDPVPNYYQRYPQFFGGLDHVLGVFTPRNLLTIEGDELRQSALTIDASTGFFTRTFSPDLAMVKAGPLYLDLLYVGAGAIWSDYNGRQSFGTGQGDGVVSYVEMGIRAALRLTDTIYASFAGAFIYLPQSNQLAFGIANGSQMGLSADVIFSDTWGEWDVSIWDRFLGRPGVNLFADAFNDGYDRAGRYQYGFQRRRSNPFSKIANEENVFLGNSIAANASRLVFDGAWRFIGQLQHNNYWQGFDFRGQSTLDQLTLLLGYEGSVLPFSPRFSYDLYSFDGYDTFYHRWMASFSGRLTETIQWAGNVGYLLTTERPGGRLIWDATLKHMITARTYHSLSFGESFFVNDVTNDALTTRFLNYTVSHSFARNVQLQAFGQVSDRESTINQRTSNAAYNTTTEIFTGGATLVYQPLDFTSIRLGYMMQSTLRGPNDFDRWLARIQVVQQLSMRLTAQLSYHYEDFHSATSQNDFTEHMVQIGIRRYF